MKKVLNGFNSAQSLPENLRDWHTTLYNRIGKMQSRHGEYEMLFDERLRCLAIQGAKGTTIPDFKMLSNEQIETLLAEVKDRPVELSGSAEFCNKMQEVAKAAGVDVRNPHQVTKAERKAAGQRYEAKAEMNNDTVPALVPR